MGIIRIKILIIIFVFFSVGFLSHSAEAATLNAIGKNKKTLYKGYIFAVSDLNGDEKSEIIAQVRDKENLSILQWNGIWFRKVGKVETPFERINDVAVGDVDNDGIDEIALISGRELYIFEKEDNRFILDETKTTPLYGEKRHGKKEVLEAMDKYVKDQTSYELDDDYVWPELKPEEIEGKLVIVGDVTNDGRNEIVLTKRQRCGYTLDILKWRDEYFEVIHSYPRIDDPYVGGGGGLGNAGIAICDLNEDGNNELFYTAERCFNIIVYNEKKNIFEPRVVCVIKPYTYIADQRAIIGKIGPQWVLVYCILKYGMEKENINEINIVYLDKDSFPHLTKPFGSLKKEESYFIPATEFASGGKFAPRHTTEKLKGIEGFVIGNLDGDKENELIVNAAAGAYIYGLKFNIALIISIIAGIILIIALAVFFIRRRKKKAITT